MITNRFFPLALFVAGMPLLAKAQEAPPIATDRPGFAFNTGVVGKGVVQVELGLPQITDVDSAGGSTRVISAIGLLRLGVSRTWELRVGAPMYNWLRTSGPGGSDQSGWGDVELGAKFHALDASGRRPAICLIPSVILPTGDDGFTSDDPGVAFNATLEWTTSKAWSIKNLSGLSSLGVPGGDRTTGWILAGAAGRTIGSSRWSAYGEVGATDNDLPGSDVAALAGGGIAVLTGNDSQLDVFFQRGLTDSAADWVYGFGLSLRFGGAP